METSIYGEHLPRMKQLQQMINDSLLELRKRIENETGMDPIEHCLTRIKSEESMREKCRRQGLPENTNSALVEIRDAIGFRVVCAFLDDVYRTRDYLISMDGMEVVQEKDYIRNVKPNGYRSYHLILKHSSGYYVEFQLRTISMDTWAALEHHMKYKKTVEGDTALITRELKRCADELASTDISMQTIRNMIRGE